MNPLEERLRDAYRAAADTVRPETVLPGGVQDLHRDGHPAARPARRVRSMSPLLVPLAAAAAVTVVVGTVYGLGSQLFSGAGPQQPPAAPTLYIYSNGSPNTVTPINTATNTRGKPIRVTGGPQGAGGPSEPNATAGGFGQIAVTPDGKTAYVTTGPSVTPISTATGTPGKPIHIDSNRFHYPDFIAITPDGKTAYIAQQDSGTIIPISTATNTPGKPIYVSPPVGVFRGPQIVITPDGKTAYVANGSGMVIPISTATNTPGKPIYVGPPVGVSSGPQIVITPNGKTAYVTNGSGAVIPISTATNRAGKPIDIRKGPPLQIAVTPDGKTVYVTTDSVLIPAPGVQRGTIRVTPISTATNTPGTPIKIDSGGIDSGGFPDNGPGFGQIAVTPDGKTIYVASWSGVTPISTATGTSGKPIHIGPLNGPNGGGIGQIVITPDGATAYVSNLTNNTVIPINTATNTPGQPIYAGGFTPAMAIIP